MSRTRRHFLDLVQNIFTCGLPAKTDAERLRLAVMINVVAITGIIHLVPLGFLAFREGNPVLGTCDFLLALTLVGIVIFIRVSSNLALGSYLGVAAGAALFIFLLLSGGVANTGFVWYYTFPLFSTFLLGSKKGAYATLFLLTVALVFFIANPVASYFAAYSFDFKVRFIPSFLVVAIYSFLFEHTREKTQNKLVIKNLELEGTVAELTAADMKLTESERKYRNLVERANDGICLIQDRLLVYVNPRLAGIVGVDREDMLFKPFSDFIDPSELPLVIDRYTRRMAGEPGPPQYETALRHRDGGRVDVELNAGIVNFKGKPADLVIVRDIREHKRVERALKEAKIAAEEANMAKSEFLAAMSHELRTPLNHIIGFTEIILDRRAGGLTTQQQEYLRDVRKSSLHLLSLIDDILDLSRVEAGKLDLKSSAFRLQSLLEHSLIMVKEKCKKHSIRLTLDINPALEDSMIEADERRIKQVMFNLLTNAAKFTPDGGRIKVTADFNGKGLLIGVIDSGIGIAPGFHQSIFEPFFQVETGIKSKTPGTGLGLSVSRQIITMHGGKIWVESAGTGKGSAFYFALPENLLAAG